MIKPFSRWVILSLLISLSITQSVFAFIPGHPLLNQYRYNQDKQAALQAIVDASNYAHAHHLGRYSYYSAAEKSVNELRTARAQRNQSQANNTTDNTDNSQ